MITRRLQFNVPEGLNLFGDMKDRIVDELARIANELYQFWLKEAQDTLKTSKEAYILALNPPQFSEDENGNPVADILLSCKDSWLVHAVEFGCPPHDLKEIYFLNSGAGTGKKPSKTSGNRRVIRMNVMTGKDPAGGHPAPSEVRALMKPSKIKDKTVLTGFGDKYKTFVGGAGSNKMSDYSIYERLTHNKTGPYSGSWNVFRTVTDTQTGKWLHPGIIAKNLSWRVMQRGETFAADFLRGIDL